MSASYRSLLIALFFTAVTAVGVTAQQGTITGRVLDRGASYPVGGADVRVGARAVQADDRGYYTIQVTPGTIEVTVTAPSYQEARPTVTVEAGETVTLTVLLDRQPIELDRIIVWSGNREPTNVTSLPVTTIVVDAQEVAARVVTTVADYVDAGAGVDPPQEGIDKRSVVTRGFNNVFSGSLLVMTDYRYARVPSLRVNSYNMIPIPPLDIDQIEMVLGPASALYGPNSANGIMHILSSSPIDQPGTKVSIAGGNRSIFTGAFRQAFKFSERAGLKVTGQYFRGNDFKYHDPAEDPDPAVPLIAARDFGVERWGGEARLDLRPWDASDDGVWLTYGVNQLGSSIELTGIGAAQARDWRYQYGQVRFRRAGFFAQAFLNASDAGDTYLLRTGNSIVDKSTVLAGQAQYSFTPIERLDLTAGFDASQTTPKTEGTINGSNENSDETLELGAYLSGRFELTEQLDLVAALRMDDHEHLENQVWSPRVGVIYEPEQGHAFRATYNRAFSTPTSNNLFLDLSAGRIPVIEPIIYYDVRTFGVPATGFTWNDQCAGGVNSYCMYSPFLEGTQLPAAGDPLWNGVIVEGMLADPTTYAGIQAIGMDSTSFRAAMNDPAPGDLTSYLLRFNHETESFGADPGVSAVERMRPTITTTYEIGYQGTIAQRLRLSASVYRSQIRDFVGPLRVETPSVFLDGTSVGTYIATRLQLAGVPAVAATAFAGQAAPTIAMIPLGTVAPDQRDNSALLLTYRNFGDVNLWGADIGFEAEVADRVFALGAYSWVSEECFDFDKTPGCSSSADIALNAPTNKGSFGLAFRDRRAAGTGLEIGARARFSGEFPMNSGVYIGKIDSYTVFDVNAAYDVPTVQGLRAALTVNNVFDNKHLEFIGAPEIGMVALLQLTYAFGGN